MIEENPTGEVTETIIAEDYVTITQRIPTRRYYTRAVAPMLEATAIRRLHDELRRFLSYISYRLECSRWNGRDALDVSEEMFTFRPADRCEEPFPKELPRDVANGLTHEMRKTMPLFAELCERWLGMTDGMREAYDGILEAQRKRVILQEQVERMANAMRRGDVDAYTRKRSEMYAAQDRETEATERYLNAVRESLGVVAKVAERHMDMTCRRIWDVDGYEEWLRESVTKDAPDSNGADGTDGGDRTG